MALRPSVEWLLVLLPVVVILDRTGAAAPLVFFVAALVIVPLAALIVRSTEQVSAYTGPAIGGLLNATFGNLPELIIAVVALRAGLVEMVRASLIGAVLANGCWRSAWRSCWAAGDSTSWTTTRPGREHTPAC
jgi:Ca2+:H+ antiporter